MLGSPIKRNFGALDVGKKEILTKRSNSLPVNNLWLRRVNSASHRFDLAEVAAFGAGFWGRQLTVHQRLRGGDVSMTKPLIDVPAVDNFGSCKDWKIAVSSAPGYSACVRLVGVVPLSLDGAWALLTHPDNHKIFRAIKV
jgi:hypothetical protein